MPEVRHTGAQWQHGYHLVCDIAAVVPPFVVEQQLSKQQVMKLCFRQLRTFCAQCLRFALRWRTALLPPLSAFCVLVLGSW